MDLSKAGGMEVVPFLRIAPLASADVDGDGLLDIAGYVHRGGDPSSYAIFPGVGPNAFDASAVYDLPENPPGILQNWLHPGGPVSFADTDGDGLIEFVTGSPLQVHERGEDGQFERTFIDTINWVAGLPFYDTQASATVVGDFDGDGRIELIVAGTGPTEQWEVEAGTATRFNSKLRVFEARGDNEYVLERQWILRGQGPIYAGSGDVDGDGVPEFAFSDSGFCRMTRLFGSGGAPNTYKLIWQFDMVSVNVGEPGPFLKVVDFGDMDGDGDDEVVIAVNHWVGVFDWRGGEMVLVHAETYCEGCSAVRVLFADLDGDGRDSLVVTAVDWTADHDFREPVPDGILIYDWME